jgi:hypothetical protein
MTKLKLADHLVGGGRVVEIWKNGRMIGTIYPADGGVKNISKYPTSISRDDSDRDAKVTRVSFFAL